VSSITCEPWVDSFFISCIHMIFLFLIIWGKKLGLCFIQTFTSGLALNNTSFIQTRVIQRQARHFVSKDRENNSLFCNKSFVQKLRFILYWEKRNAPKHGQSHQNYLRYNACCLTNTGNPPKSMRNPTAFWDSTVFPRPIPIPVASSYPNSAKVFLLSVLLNIFKRPLFMITWETFS